ncbi:hypothetical protein AB0J86_13590 [Micromonospora sp. NPDC049559]|uniref:hypothetical protein n=1 Tax=Micromonospora sp. NPDC049559 TaxID=3155923 RepID=UPI0034439C2A
MSTDASPFFIRPHRFDDPGEDDRTYPRLDGRRQIALDASERVLWRGRVGLSGYLLGPRMGNGVLHWSLPGRVEVTVTDRRLAFVREGSHLERVAAGADADPEPLSTGRHRRRPPRAGNRVAAGQVRWQWPSRLHLLPAAAATAYAPARPEQVLLVCDSLRTIRQPALALAGGDLGTPGAARDLLHLVRRAIARFRLAHSGTVELSPPERDALTSRAGSRLFADELADPDRGIQLPGSLVIEFLHRDDYYRRAARSQPSPTRAPRTGTPEYWRSGQPGSAS